MARIRRPQPASTARAEAKAAQDRRIAAAVASMPDASDQRIAAEAMTSVWSVKAWRAAKRAE